MIHTTVVFQPQCISLEYHPTPSPTATPRSYIPYSPPPALQLPQHSVTILSPLIGGTIQPLHMRHQHTQSSYSLLRHQTTRTTTSLANAPLSPKNQRIKPPTASSVTLLPPQCTQHILYLQILLSHWPDPLSADHSLSHHLAPPHALPRSLRLENKDNKPQASRFWRI